MPTTKVGTQWFAVDSKDQPTGAPLDIELAYETYGQPSAAPLLLCNGVSMQGVLFGAEFLQALAAAGPYYVIVYDARDTGLSTKIEGAGDPAIAQVFAQKQLGMKQERKDGIPYFISCVQPRPPPPCWHPLLPLTSLLDAATWLPTPSACSTHWGFLSRMWSGSRRSAAPPHRGWPSSTPHACPR
jgi:hypothetical protein